MQKMAARNIPQEPAGNGAGKWLIAGAILLFLFFISIIVGGLISIALVGKDIGQGNIAIIPIMGPIQAEGTDSFLTGSVASSRTIVESIRKAEEDPQIKAIIFEINSPGGSPVASDEIGQAIKQAKKPTVAWVREMGASGGYWIASSCDHIVANRMSAVGSIGVLGSYLEFSGLMDDYNVTYQRLVAGKYKDVGSPFRQLTAEEEQIYQELLDQLHEVFIEEVAQNRNLSVEEVRELATGWIYLGQEAKELGLVDEIGGRQEAIAHIEQELGIEGEIVEYRRQKTFIEALVSASSASSYTIGRGMGDAIIGKDDPAKSPFSY